MRTRAGSIGGQPRGCPPRRGGRLAAVLAAAIVFAAACGSGPSQQSLRLGRVFTGCMRVHGFRSFPESAVTVSNGDVNVDPLNGGTLPLRSPALRAALRACGGAVGRAEADRKHAG